MNNGGKGGCFTCCGEEIETTVGGSRNLNGAALYKMFLNPHIMSPVLENEQRCVVSESQNRTGEYD